MTLRWYWFRLKQKLALGRQSAWRVRPRQTSQPLTVRLQGTSDLMLFEQIFIADEYACVRDLNHVSVVIDLGANVGFSSACFLSRFPNARVVAVEPDDENVAMCRENLARYGARARILHGAAWSECTKLCFSSEPFRDGLEWSKQVTLPAEGEKSFIEGWDVGTILDMAQAETVDLLKIDIERGELAVFQASSREWLPRVRNICIELHGPDCEQAFFSALSDFDFDLKRAGELTVCRNLRLRV